MERKCGCDVEVTVSGQTVLVTIPPNPAVGINPYNGPMESAVVSQSASVCVGEFVRKVIEYAPPGDTLRILMEDVQVLDAVELSRGRVGVVFTQKGKTKFKVVSLESGALTMGNTLVLVDDEAVSTAALVEIDVNRAAVLYTYEELGTVSIITLDDRSASLAYTDAWCEGDPTNICACAMGDGSFLAAAMLRGVTPAGNPGEMLAWQMRTVDTGGGKVQATSRARIDADCDVDEYTHAWSLSAVTDTTAVLAFFRATDKPVGFAVLDVDRYAPIAVRIIGTGKYATSLPCIQTAPLGRGRWLMAYGVSWLPKSGLVRSALAVEIWGLTRYAVELGWYGCDDVAYDTGLGAVSALPAGAGAGVGISFTPLAEKGAAVGKSLFMALDDGGPSPGATISLVAHDGFCRVVPISQTRAILLWQADGNAYARALQLEERITPSSTLIHGLAVTAGGPGEKVSLRVSRLDT